MGITDHAVPLESGAPEVTDELARWIWAESGTEQLSRTPAGTTRLLRSPVPCVVAA